jgi:hypothetical protein
VGFGRVDRWLAVRRPDDIVFAMRNGYQVGRIHARRVLATVMDLFVFLDVTVVEDVCVSMRHHVSAPEPESSMAFG